MFHCSSVNCSHTSSTFLVRCAAAMPEQRAPSLWPELQGFFCCVVGSKINNALFLLLEYKQVLFQILVKSNLSRNRQNNNSYDDAAKGIFISATQTK